MLAPPEFVPKMIRKRQVNPAAFSGVSDQISNIGQSAGQKASSATAGLTRSQTALVIVFCIIGVVLIVSALFWVCSWNRRKKRRQEVAEKAKQLRVTSMQNVSPSSSFNTTHKGPHSAYTNQNGWGESRVALNSSFITSTHQMYGWDQSQNNLTSDHNGCDRPRQPQQAYRY